MPPKKINISFEFYANNDNTSQIITNILVFHNWVKKDWFFVKMVPCLGNYLESMIFWLIPPNSKSFIGTNEKCQGVKQVNGHLLNNIIIILRYIIFTIDKIYHKYLAFSPNINNKTYINLKFTINYKKIIISHDKFIAIMVENMVSLTQKNS
jgi:hypothetical protein